MLHQLTKKIQQINKHKFYIKTPLSLKPSKNWFRFGRLRLYVYLKSKSHFLDADVLMHLANIATNNKINQ